MQNMKHQMPKGKPATVASDGMKHPGLLGKLLPHTHSTTSLTVHAWMFSSLGQNDCRAVPLTGLVCSGQEKTVFQDYPNKK
jgi:hypothetical protein